MKLVWFFVRNMRGPKKTAHPLSMKRASPEAQLAIALFKLVGDNLPMRTPVDSIPAQYASIFGKKFPLPIPPGPTGLANLLGSEFGQILSFSQNRAGQVFAELGLPKETSPEQIARFFDKDLSQPTAPQVRPGPPAGLVIAAMEKLLAADKKIGEAANETGLEEKLAQVFFQTFRVPVNNILATVLTDKRFRLNREPVTGSIALSISSGNIIPQTVPVRTVQVAPVAPVAPQFEPVLVRLRKLRSDMLSNLEIIDAAITRGSNLVIPDFALWTNALDTLLKQEGQSSEILANLFAG